MDNHERLATCADLRDFYVGPVPQHALDEATGRALGELRFCTDQISFHLGAVDGWRGKDERMVERNLSDARRNIIPGKVWVRRLRKLNPPGSLGAQMKAAIASFDGVVARLYAQGVGCLSLAAE
jgi:hypothetical protein